MARGGLYKSDVQKARDALRAQGKHPSVDAVRVALGNTGSKTTIHRYLKELEEEEGQGLGAKVAVSDALQDLVGRLAGRLHEEAEAVVAEARQRFNFLNAPRGVTVSAEVGLIKPDRKIFEHHVASFGLAPENTLFIDDVPANVAGAQGAGWQAVQFTGAEKLRADLSAFGIAA